jgi:hypothetical protein
LFFYDKTLGALVLYGEEETLTSGDVTTKYVNPDGGTIVMKIPFSVDTLGCFVVERRSDMGGEMKFSFESLEPVQPPMPGADATGVFGTGLTGKFDCKGTFELNSSGDPIANSTWDKDNGILKTTQNTEEEFHRVLLRPTQESLQSTIEETLHPALPMMGVLKIEIRPPAAETGSDGLQWVRSIGFSKYNVPQVPRVEVN